MELLRVSKTSCTYGAPSQDSNLKTNALALAGRRRLNELNQLRTGSPVWTTLELLRYKSRSARTNKTRFIDKISTRVASSRQYIDWGKPADVTVSQPS
jgi:hypothetical protein